MSANMYDAWDCGDRPAIREQLKQREDIIRMAREAGFADGVAAERERIIEKNAPVIEQINAHMKEAVAAEREVLIALLKGIDKTETESPDGWWETSKGADFGAGILAAIRERGQE